MSLTIRWYLLITIVSLIFAGCATDEPASPETAGKEPDAAEVVKSGSGKAIEKVSKGMQTAGEATGKALQTAGEATGKALQEAGQASKDAGQTAGEAVGVDKK